MPFMKQILTYSKRKLFKYSQERLDYQFKLGKWDWLESLDELPRYSLLIGGHRFHNPGGSILDLGCGQGILLNRFRPEDYSYYMAVDYADEALKHITPNDKIAIAKADLTKYIPEKNFDSIIFNESLYYVKNPLDQVARYSNFLNPNGALFTSIHLRKNAELVNDIKSNFEVLDQTTVINKWGESWACLTIKKAGVKTIMILGFLLEMMSNIVADSFLDPVVEPVMGTVVYYF